MRKSPYTLEDKTGGTNGYYCRIRTFSDCVSARADVEIAPVTREFSDFLSHSGLAAERKGTELYVEALGLGVMWKVYGARLDCKRLLLRNALARVTKMRGHARLLKNMLDRLKGLLLPAVFSGKVYKTGAALPTVKQLENVRRSLAAIGDFEYETERFKLWTDFLSALPEERAVAALSAIMRFTKWFAAQSEEALGAYTAGTADFIRDHRKFYRFREDSVFCLRQPLEYHFNLVGAELLGRAFAQDYAAMAQKRVLLPICMRIRPEGDCKARQSALGLVCTHCTPGCPTGETAALCEKSGVEVLLIPHESTAFHGVPPCGIVGVSCSTRLVEGGFMARKLGFWPQCVVLNSSGCRKHWDTAGRVTTLDTAELARILRIPAASKPGGGEN